jgi:endonuclease YncB( thermonuclease family)
LIAGLILCASLTAVDGDTVKCDGQNMRLLGEGVPFVSGIDTPEIGRHAKCTRERKLALIAKGRLKELLAEKGLRIVANGAVDRTPSHRPLVNIYRTNGEEIGTKLLKEGFARTWSPKQRFWRRRTIVQDQRQHQHRNRRTHRPCAGAAILRPNEDQSPVWGTLVLFGIRSLGCRLAEIKSINEVGIRA